MINLALGMLLTLTARQVVPNAMVPPEEQKKILREAHIYATDYSRNLPNFICTEVVRRYSQVTGKNTGHTDIVKLNLSFFDQKERYRVISVNNRPANLSLEELGGATTQGEFGTQLKAIFAPESRAQFTWVRWARLRGRRTHVFSYRISRENSQWTVVGENQKAVVGYTGQIHVDADTGMVLRFTCEATEFPKGFPIDWAKASLDYGFVKLKNREFLLPLRFETRLSGSRIESKNEAAFQQYRKFGSEATIRFDEAEPAPK